MPKYNRIHLTIPSKKSMVTNGIFQKRKWEHNALNVFFNYFPILFWDLKNATQGIVVLCFSKWKIELENQNFTYMSTFYVSRSNYIKIIISLHYVGKLVNYTLFVVFSDWGINFSICCCCSNICFCWFNTRLD